ncbi:DNA-directed RNA polymerase II subunit RPB1 [Platanthera zijinensis]|uniref:DNA-directed RNA polymerase II subunit RPB1 n=1 Tax=Platanthera zijinensis TaxID=2320716 RepID=A0AAP0GG19_9ASPA
MVEVPDLDSYDESDERVTAAMTVLAIMRCVCFNCSKILADEQEKCAGGDDLDVQGQQDSEEPLTKSRGGCGAQQPKITIDGIKMIAEYKASNKKYDDQELLPEPVERKQVLSIERVTIP